MYVPMEPGGLGNADADDDDDDNDTDVHYDVTLHGETTKGHCKDDDTLTQYKTHSDVSLTAIFVAHRRVL